MLSDSTCWFLAVDFDKTTWTEDVRAFIATCRKLDLPFVVERSRSGNGAHVWFFFSAPVSAWSARKLGSYVLTPTMSARHELSMDSYDRLFPSQDQMPKGGFGNLIALPFQKEARKLGNTELRCGFQDCRQLKRQVASGGATQRQPKTVDRTVDESGS